MMFDADPSATPREQMIAFRKQAGLSMAKMAKLVGLRSASAWQYYEERFHGEEIPKFIRVVMTGVAEPDTSAAEVGRLRGRLQLLSSFISLYRQDRISAEEMATMISTILEAEAR